ncbi:MAG: amidase [Actinobacteria bacterium]|nr:amidase [Actinomycetota bacterium]
MSTFITRLDPPGAGVRVAVKDIIDVAGVQTTAGSRALADRPPAERDAACLAGLRAAGARIVGKANLHELAMLPFGINPWFGTPRNPLDPALIPGGSSSGSAVAVASDEADIALGTDTGGSVRIPAACCGVAGLKTTHGRVSLDGVWPLAPSLDTVGPLARDVAGLVTGMQLLEPGFTPAAPARTVGRARAGGDPVIERAIDAALATAELDVVPVDLDGWDAAVGAFIAIELAETWESDAALLGGAIGDDSRQILEIARASLGYLDEARAQQQRWRASLAKIFEHVELLALPTISIFPPRIEDVPAAGLALAADLARNCLVFNAAGVPAVAVPVPSEGPFPASLQLVGPHRSEEILLPTAARIEDAIG